MSTGIRVWYSALYVGDSTGRFYYIILQMLPCSKYTYKLYMYSV